MQTEEFERYLKEKLKGLTVEERTQLFKKLDAEIMVILESRKQSVA